MSIIYGWMNEFTFFLQLPFEKFRVESFNDNNKYFHFDSLFILFYTLSRVFSCLFVLSLHGWSLCESVSFGPGENYFIGLGWKTVFHRQFLDHQPYLNTPIGYGFFNRILQQYCRPQCLPQYKISQKYRKYFPKSIHNWIQ